MKLLQSIISDIHFLSHITFFYEKIGIIYDNVALYCTMLLHEYYQKSLLTFTHDNLVENKARNFPYYLKVIFNNNSFQ